MKTKDIVSLYHQLNQVLNLENLEIPLYELRKKLETSTDVCDMERALLDDQLRSQAQAARRLAEMCDKLRESL